jgi:UDP-2,3-diacylglucosamine pyrophosphatase LpxH
MRTSVFVVSDLHLGGAEGFRMCEAEGRRRLAELFRWILDQASSSLHPHIVIAGDIVDFLAEKPYSAFTGNEDDALLKLESILQGSDEIWTALAEAAARCSITLMLGNHDVELSLPKPRRRLVERIGRPVEFLYDNEAFTCGALIVEHGNRYEGWNVVDHDALRRARSRLSRGESGAAFPTQPGSELVINVMNRIKQQYPWVDLLKPETAAVVPILAALGVSPWQVATQATKAAAAAAWRQTQFAPDGKPSAPSFISAEAPEAVSEGVAVQHPLDDLKHVFATFEGLQETAPVGGADERMVGAGAVTIKEELLFRGLRRWGERDNRSFQIDRENRIYLRAAEGLTTRGYKVVVFGHTHHAKRIDLAGGGRYLNTGTWADLMRIPEAVFTADEPVAREAFGGFMTALKTGASDLRRLIPTFARIDFDEGGAVMADRPGARAADVWLFDKSGEAISISTEEILGRLQ